jgi:hypothetical protein
LPRGLRNQDLLCRTGMLGVRQLLDLCSVSNCYHFWNIAHPLTWTIPRHILLVVRMTGQVSPFPCLLVVTSARRTLSTHLTLPCLSSRNFITVSSVFPSTEQQLTPSSLIWSSDYKGQSTVLSERVWEHTPGVTTLFLPYLQRQRFRLMRFGLISGGRHA